MDRMDNLEYCFKCDEPTGCAGRADDSHYNEDGEGPFCWRCWCEDENPRLNDLIDSQQQALKAKDKYIDQLQQRNLKLQFEIDHLNSTEFVGFARTRIRKIEQLKAALAAKDKRIEELDDTLAKDFNVAVKKLVGPYKSELAAKDRHIKELEKELAEEKRECAEGWRRWKILRDKP